MIICILKMSPHILYPLLVLVLPLPCPILEVLLLHVDISGSAWVSHRLYNNPATFMPSLLMFSHLSPCWGHGSVSSATKGQQWWPLRLLLVVPKGTSSLSSADGADSFIPRGAKHRGEKTDKASACIYVIKKEKPRMTHPRRLQYGTCILEQALFIFHSLKFQVILFLRQKPVECYIGVNRVDFNALGHLDTGRQRRNWGRILWAAQCVLRVVGTGWLKQAVPWRCSPLQQSELVCRAHLLLSQRRCCRQQHLELWGERTFLLVWKQTYGPTRHGHVCVHTDTWVCLPAASWLCSSSTLNCLICSLSSPPSPLSQQKIDKITGNRWV